MTSKYLTWKPFLMTRISQNKTVIKPTELIRKHRKPAENPCENRGISMGLTVKSNHTLPWIYEIHFVFFFHIHLKKWWKHRKFLCVSFCQGIWDGYSKAAKKWAPSAQWHLGPEAWAGPTGCRCGTHLIETSDLGVYHQVIVLQMSS